MKWTPQESNHIIIAVRKNFIEFIYITTTRALHKGGYGDSAPTCINFREIVGPIGKEKTWSHPLDKFLKGSSS